jgi:serine O-acetyltransferase
MNNLFYLLRLDYRKYKMYGGNFFSIIFLTQGFWALSQYRIGHSIYTNITIKPLRFLFMIPIFFWQKTIEIMTGISITASVKIGHSFYIGHFGNIIINANTVIGNNCNISQGVTIGVSGIGDKRGVPIIGDNVYIGANSVLAGKIIIGSNTLIGACTLVNRDVPENAVIMGVPGKIISYKGSKGYI